MEPDVGWLQPAASDQRGSAAAAIFERIWQAQRHWGCLQMAAGAAVVQCSCMPETLRVRHRHVAQQLQLHPYQQDYLALHPPVVPEPVDGDPQRHRYVPPPPPPEREQPFCVHGGCPWIVADKVYSKGIVGLHEEIEDFYLYMTPTQEEHFMRTTVFERIRAVIAGLWSRADVHTFGSFETGLYLPTSDIDIVVIGKWDQSPLEALKEALIRADVSDACSIKVLDKAVVPIIKLTDRCTDVKVDISFNMNNGLVSARHIKRYMLQFPLMPKLVIVLKQFLLQRELNEVFTGGISSYSLILMTVSFLQTHERRVSVFPGCNLGVLLIEFFEFYGIKFNYFNTCIKVKDGGYVPRSEVEDQFAGHSPHNSPLCIEDPHNSSNDIGRASYNLMSVKEAFKHAHARLSLSVLGAGSARDPNVTSLLCRVVRVSDLVIDYRRSIRQQYRLPPPLPPLRPPHPALIASLALTAATPPRSSTSPHSSTASDASEPDGDLVPVAPVSAVSVDSCSRRCGIVAEVSPQRRSPGIGVVSTNGLATPCLLQSAAVATNGVSTSMCPAHHVTTATNGLATSLLPPHLAAAATNGVSTSICPAHHVTTATNGLATSLLPPHLVAAATNGVSTSMCPAHHVTTATNGLATTDPRSQNPPPQGRGSWPAIRRFQHQQQQRPRRST